MTCSLLIRVDDATGAVRVSCQRCLKFEPTTLTRSDQQFVSVAALADTYRMACGCSAPLDPAPPGDIMDAVRSIARGG